MVWDLMMFVENLGNNVQVRNKTLNVYHSVAGDQQTYILFVHGMWGNIIQFKDQIAYFKDKFSILAVDIVGHGNSAYSSNIDDYKISNTVEDLLSVMERYEVRNKRIVIVAHSYGALISKKLSTKLNYLAGIIFVAPLGFISQPLLKSIQLALKMMPTFMLNFFRWVENIGGVNGMGAKSALGPNPPQSAREVQYYIAKRNSSIFVKKTVFGLEIAAPDEFDCIKVPALVIGGEYDTVTKPNAHAKAIHKVMGLPETNFVMYPTGHVIMVEEPVRLNKDIESFLKKIL